MPKTFKSTRKRRRFPSAADVETEAHAFLGAVLAWKNANSFPGVIPSALSAKMFVQWCDERIILGAERVMVRDCVNRIIRESQPDAKPQEKPARVVNALAAAAVLADPRNM